MVSRMRQAPAAVYVIKGEAEGEASKATPWPAVWITIVGALARQSARVGSGRR
jgi:hypothetical protein